MGRGKQRSKRRQEDSCREIRFEADSRYHVGWTNVVPPRNGIRVFLVRVVRSSKNFGLHEHSVNDRFSEGNPWIQENSVRDSPQPSEVRVGVVVELLQERRDNLWEHHLPGQNLNQLVLPFVVGDSEKHLASICR